MSSGPTSTIGTDETRRMHPAVDHAVVTLLRSPLHRLADSHLCELRYQAPRSGRAVSLPVMYAPWENSIVVMVGRAASKQWWRAFRSPLPVEVCAGRNAHRGIGMVLSPDDSRFEPATAEYERCLDIRPAVKDQIVLIDFATTQPAP
jgi:hypothetical protein